MNFHHGLSIPPRCQWLRPLCRLLSLHTLCDSRVRLHGHFRHCNPCPLRHDVSLPRRILYPACDRGNMCVEPFFTLSTAPSPTMASIHSFIHPSNRISHQVKPLATMAVPGPTKAGPSSAPGPYRRCSSSARRPSSPPPST